MVYQAELPERGHSLPGLASRESGHVCYAPFGVIPNRPTILGNIGIDGLRRLAVAAVEMA